MHLAGVHDGVNHSSVPHAFPFPIPPSAHDVQAHQTLHKDAFNHADACCFCDETPGWYGIEMSQYVGKATTKISAC